METCKYSIIFSISGRTIAGTTDTPTKLTFSPKPTKSEVQFILDEIKDYLSEDIRGKCMDCLICTNNKFFVCLHGDKTYNSFVCGNTKIILFMQ